MGLATYRPLEAKLKEEPVSSGYSHWNMNNVAAVLLLTGGALLIYLLLT